jgi:hypothetical protein
MNCQLFEGLIVDLVREHGLEDSVRSQALAHAESCAYCSARLESQRALSAVLKLAGAEGGEAPAHVETALLSAYRARQAKMASAGSSSRTARFIPYSFWGIAAAVIIAILGVATFRLLQIPHSSQVAGPAQNVATPGTSPATRLEPTPAPAPAKDEPTPIAARLEPAAKKTAPRQPAAKAQPADEEIATDFFPLASGTEIASMESGQLVRVLLPRNAMASYGLPVNQERADEPVTAQVLIGQDGVARAIRFLSGQNTNFVQTGLRSKR